VGLIDATGRGELARFPTADGWTTTFRSALHFPAPQGRPLRRPVPLAGPRAIESYLDEEPAGGSSSPSSRRSRAASFEETFVYGWKFTLEELVA
jgi:hypothetical protein